MWARTAAGTLINLDHSVKLTIPNKTGNLVVEGRNDVIGQIPPEQSPPTGLIMRAQPGQTAVLLFRMNLDSEDYDFEDYDSRDFWMMTCEVIAWQIHGTRCTPIVAGDTGGTSEYSIAVFIVHPTPSGCRTPPDTYEHISLDGRTPSGRWSSIEDAIADFIRFFEERRARKSPE